MLDLLLDLLPLHRCYKAREIEPPPVLADAVRRMLLNLRAMRLGDGSLARFNGAGTTRAEALATVLAFDTGEGPLPAELPASGYVRLERGQTILLMDCAAPPALEFAGRAQAGCLAFEMSDGSRALLVNGGYPGTSRRDDRPAARATANHNTLTVNGQSSARFVASPAITRLCGDAALTGPAAVTFRFMAHNGAHAFEAMHDGYAETMLLMHSRRLELSQDGQRLEGRDRLGARQGVLRLGRDLPFAIHFHLAPRIRPQIEVSEGKSSVRLIVPGQPDWRLTTDDAEILIEASQRYDTAAPTPPSRQIVLRGSCPGEATVTWTLQRLPE